MIQQLRQSLSARIMLLAGLNLILLIAIGLAASGVRVPRSLGQMLLQSAEPRLQDVTRRIALDLERTQPNEANALLDRYGREYGTRFLLVQNDGTVVAGPPMTLPDPVRAALSGPPPGSGGRGARDGFRPPPKGPFPGGPPDRLGPPDARSGLRMPQTPAALVSVGGDPKHWIVLRTPIRFAGAPEIIPGSLIIVPHGLLSDPLLLPTQWLWWVLLSLAVTTACWWPMLRGVTKSLGKMEQATREIARGQFGTTVGISRSDEIGRLSASIQSMAARLGALISGQKRFLGDTAHEFRSPLGRMQIALELLDSRVNDSERGYVADLKEDVDALRLLTDDLLQYARAELADRSRAMESLPLAPVVERVIAKEGNGATIANRIDPATAVQGDPQLVERAIANVVRNAVKYAGQAGPITIATTNEGDRLIVSITDEGPGVSPESLDRIFDPFFRGDTARHRKTGGVGLGLAIVRSAIEACGGVVQCRNRQPHGLEVRLALPVTAAPSSSSPLKPTDR
jgi:two-component system sensor histidine kinase CpxA